MRTGPVARVILGVVLVASTSVLPVLAQQPAAAKSNADLSGVWVQGGTRDKEIDRSDFPESQWSKQKLPFTPAGRAAFDANRPAGGPRQARSELSNDPQDKANPGGLYRDLMYANNGRPMEMLQLPGKIVQLFSVGRVWRIIYTDGRPVPNDIAAGPFWYGYSVGRWEGDTLIVNSLALDNRAWLDDWGTPMGPGTRVEERWRRVAQDRLQLTITVTDPEFYTRPWTSEPIVYQLMKPGSEPVEIIYAPVDVEHFNETLLIPSASKNPQPTGK